MTTRYEPTGLAHIRHEVGLSVVRRPAHTIARLRGELDVATAPALRERLAGLLRPRMRLLVLDLSEISFCDAAGLAVLIGTQRRARLFGITVRLTAPVPLVANVLRVTGLDRSLSVHRTLADALAQPLTRPFALPLTRPFAPATHLARPHGRAAHPPASQSVTGIHRPGGPFGESDNPWWP